MRTLKQFVIRNGKESEAEAEEITMALMQWLRERQAESRYSLDEIRERLSGDRPPLLQPDLESFFACDNPCFYHFWAVMTALGEPISEMMRIIHGLPDDRLPARLRDQIHRGYEIKGTDFIDDCEDRRSAELN